MRVVSIAFVAAVLPLSAFAAEHVVTLDPAKTHVDFTLDATGHDVEGILALREGSLRFDPETGAASGSLVVDLAAADTGNKSRDKTMHKDVLESEKFPLATFRPSKVVGTVAPEGRSEVEIEGTMSLHGEDHPMTLKAAVTIEGSSVRAEVRFPVPYVEWGLHDPSWFVLRVAKSVSVTVDAAGSIETLEAEAR